MEILRYSDLDARGLEEHVERAAALLREGDFRAADARKMTGSPFYRARLNDKDRLLFRFVVHDGKTSLVLLEVVRNHAYEKSRFLNGAAVDESRLVPLPDPAQAPPADVLPLNFVNPQIQRVHMLDKILSFDDLQEAAYRHRMPLILIGSAGSGKTVLTLEKMKQMSGDVLYVTHSAYLVENARSLYYGSGYENDGQNVSFLSFQEFVETIRVPQGNVLDFRTFSNWVARHRQGLRLPDAHQIYEEFNGVLTGSPVTSPYLAREDYLALGVRRSIFTGEQRKPVYDLFLKYLDFLREEGLEDLNLLCFRYHEACRPSYDAVVVDEVQDLTNVQLSLVLQSLRRPERFILCGDSNQIVHPNFFSWAALKTLFYENRLKATGEIIRILNTNYRNTPEVTGLANRLLLVKNARFGSIDRESHYLVRPISNDRGRVEFLADTDAVKREFDTRTSRSTRFAVLVMRPEDKEAAARCFRTPLLFCIQEAKGLEYENIILYNFVSGSGAEFKEIASGVEAADLKADFTYARAKDKSDKSLEAFKFYINALYVAMTRAVRNLYIIERDTGHRLFRLLGLDLPGRAVKLKVQDSTAEEWQAEAQRLELQGKKEQAEAIRRRILETQPVPWPVITPDGLAQLEAEALDPKEFNRQAKLLLFEYAVMHSALHLLPKLAALKFGPALRVDLERPAVENKYSQDCQGAHPVLDRKIERYGIDYRNPLNQTPLMVAARMGREDLVRELVAQGADVHARDNWGRIPLQIALHSAYTRPDYARTAIGAVYPLLAPSALKVRAQERLIKIDGRCMEFFLLHSMLALFEEVVRRKVRYSYPAFETGDFVDSLQPFPAHVIPEYRRRRAYLSGVLARNELHRDAAGNRALFLRVSHGFYVPNPAMDIALENDWINVCDLLHLETMDEGADKRLRDLLDVMRHVRAHGKLEDSIRLESSPYGGAPTLGGIARGVRGEKEPWEGDRAGGVDEDDPGHDSGPGPAETPSARDLQTAPGNEAAEGRPERPETAPGDEAAPSPRKPPAVPVPAVTQLAFPVGDLSPEPPPGKGSTLEALASSGAPHTPVRVKAGSPRPAQDLAPAPSRPPDAGDAGEPPLPPLPEIVLPEYTRHELQLLQRFRFPPRPYPMADGERVAADPDRFGPALLETVLDALSPLIREAMVADRYNPMGYAAAAYILAGARNRSLLPPLLHSAADPDLARFLLRHEDWLEFSRILATMAQQDAAPVLNLAAWKPLAPASRGLLLRALSFLFSWKCIPRESVVSVFRQTFEPRIPASDIELWDAVISTCWIVHPREVMGPLRRQLPPAVCRKLGLNRSDLEQANVLPIDLVVSESRACTAGPILGWEDFAKVLHSLGAAPESDEDGAGVEPVHVAPKAGRNDPCPCGSGRKFKKCCGAGQPG